MWRVFQKDCLSYPVLDQSQKWVNQQQIFMGLVASFDQLTINEKSWPEFENSLGGLKTKWRHN